jgi:hypothetical protein
MAVRVLMSNSASSGDSLTFLPHLMLVLRHTWGGGGFQETEKESVIQNQ